MANIFAFRLSEQQLLAALTVIQKKRQDYPDVSTPWGLEVSIELIPDGTGYEPQNLQIQIVSERESACLDYMVAEEVPSLN